MRELKGWLGVAALTLALASAQSPAPLGPALTFIVQGRDSTSAAARVLGVGGLVTHDLPIVNAVGARLTSRQLATLRSERDAVRVYEDGGLRVAGGLGLPTYYPALVGATRLWGEHTTGNGVTVAVLDTGYDDSSAIRDDMTGHNRQRQAYNAITDRVGWSEVKDLSGHGNHVLSLAVSSNFTQDALKKRTFNGVAPDADVVVVQAFDENGAGTYANVIRGIDWVVANKVQYNIRVLNCSFSAPPHSRYWDDPLNQAIMKAWQAGIVVVVSAGNTGPNPMTVGVPGNNPYVITVGAMTDNYTPSDPSDDYLASFSSTGPTTEGFVKPDLLAPGGHMVGLMAHDDVIPTQHPAFRVLTANDQYYTMSGTSQAAGVVSGVAALVIQENPKLSPDDVKCTLMAAARPALNADGTRAYTIFQQGAGLVDAYAAVHSLTTGCANGGLDIAADLAGLQHFGGPAHQDTDGNYYLAGLQGDGYLWNGGYLWGNGYLWNSSTAGTDAYIWNNAYLWNDAYLWSNGYLWNDAYLWNASLASASINAWVDQQ